MPRTAAISDLHLGAYSGMCVLEQPGVADRLAERLAEFDRLILLGDVLELGERRPTAEVMSIAGPVLDRLARAGASEIVLVPGNHDRLLVRGWLAEQGAGLALSSVVPADASPLLSQLVARLGTGGARVEVRYAGFALSDSVWMTHGHYLDRLLSPEWPYGLLRRGPLLAPADYEGRKERERGGGLAWAALKALARPSLAPVFTHGLDRQMRHHALPALAAALGALGVHADHVVFGHVHRLGPLADDAAAEWSFSLGPDAAPTRFWNTGSWQNDPLLVRPRRRDPGRVGPYWPGGGVVIEDDGRVRAVRLLQGAELGPGFGD